MDNKEASKLYREQYNKGEELVPDYVYDTMFESSEAEVDDIGQGELIDHVHPMLSLPTYYLDIDTITEEVVAGLGIQLKDNAITVSYKLDGVPCSAILTKDGWKRCVSRGRRFQGFKMNEAFLKVLPKPIKMPVAEQVIDFRGEFVLSKDDFEILNAALPEVERYANPRSMVSAQINSKDVNPDIVAKMKWLAHGIWIGNSAEDHFEMLPHWLTKEDICPNYRFGRNNLQAEGLIKDNIKQIYESAMRYDYPCDGIVLQHRVTSDNNGKCNLDRIAIKQFDESKYSAQTKVSAIEWRLANNGSYFPRLWFEPVSINGSEVTHAAGYCYDYLKRLGLSIGASVVVTMRGGVIPYVSKVLHIGNGDYQFPEDAIEPEDGDMQLWSSNSEDAIQRMRFVRGMHMLDLKDCGNSMFSDMYDIGYKDLFTVAADVQANNLMSVMIHEGEMPDTEATRTKIQCIIDRFKTINYVWFILALREPGIGYKAANVIGHILSGYTLIQIASRGSGKTAIQNFLNNTELCNKVKTYAQPVALEHADLSVEHTQQLVQEDITQVRPKVCMSKKPTNGMTKAHFATAYLRDYDITDNIKEANLLVCPAGEVSNKIKYAESNNITIKHYEDFYA